MTNLSLEMLFVFLVVLIVVSGFFSGSETGMMALNRYRLRHLARKGDKRAIRVLGMLKRPDRLLGVILIGNTFANVFASAVATIMAVRLFGDMGIAIATVLLTLAILIFAEVTPKTLAATYPQRTAFFASLPLRFLSKALYPLVWAVAAIATGLLRIFHMKPRTLVEPLTRDELRTVVHEAGEMIDVGHQNMLLRILDLDDIHVEDVMIPRNEVVGIDIEDDWETVLRGLTDCPFTSLPVYQDNIDQVRGILRLSAVLSLLSEGRLNKATLLQAVQKPYFIPEGTSVTQQLLGFQKHKSHTGLVVDEYGDIQGLIAMEDILEEIVGGMSIGLPAEDGVVRSNRDGSFLVNGADNIRELNRQMGWSLPVDGPKTVNGLIMEQLEAMPQRGDQVEIGDYGIEVIAVRENTVRMARFMIKG